MSAEFDALAERLAALFACGVDTALPSDQFDEVALAVFSYQFSENATYRAYCEARGVTPDSAGTWERVPPVPAKAFKHLDLVSGGGAVEAVYETSGTTGGRQARGRHLVPRRSLYRASALPNFRAHLIPEGGAVPLVSLIPSPSDASSSSLSEMVGFVAEEAATRTWWLGGEDGAPDAGAFVTACGESMDGGLPVLVVGTAFAFVHLLDALADAGTKVVLPEGSRVMETGGFKGRSREVVRGDFYAAIAERLGVPPRRVVNEYGMTELLSQLYEPVLRDPRIAAGPVGERPHAPPPWLRVRALDPDTLVPVPDGAPGLLAFYDLANLGSVSHVLTEDLGTVDPDGVRLKGRSRGAEPRGCSLAMEGLLSATGVAR